MSFLHLFVFLWLKLVISQTQTAYDAAAQCADDYLGKHANVPRDWMPTGIFGGLHNEKYVGFITHANTSLPDINMMDGPQGLRDILVGMRFPERVSWPAASTYGLAWSPELAYYAGSLGALDWRHVGANVALTPGVNVHRVPIGGRNWEYISGEDPLLGRMGGALTAGLQSEGMMGSLKHFALNSQELNREGVISIVDESVLMESYIRAFQPAIDAGIGSVMCSYNQIQFTSNMNSHAYTCGSSHLSGILLRDVLGFRAALMTDWDAQYSNTTKGHVADARAVSDWEMRWEGIPRGVIPDDQKHTLARNALVGMFASGILTDDTIPSCADAKVTVPPPDISALPAYYQEAIKSKNVTNFVASLISEGMVLLKNDNNALPLIKDSRTPHKRRRRKEAECQSFDQQDCKGNDISNSPVRQYQDCCGLCDGTDGCVAFTWAPYDPNGAQNPTCYLKSSCSALTSNSACVSGQTIPQDKFRVLLAGTALLNGGGSGDSAAFGWYQTDHAGEDVHTGGEHAKDVMARTLSSALNASVQWDNGHSDPSLYDVVIVFGGQFRSESYLVGNTDGYYQIDQCGQTPSAGLYGDCDFPSFMKRFQSARADGTIVVAVTTTGGSHLVHEYIDQTDAAITLMYPGQFFAQALAKVLRGDVSPGGRLTHTLPSLEADGIHIQSPIGRYNHGLKYIPGGRNTLTTPAFFWDENTNSASEIIQYGSYSSTHEEGNLVGYKYYEKYNILPAFGFGFGLSYEHYTVTADFTDCLSRQNCHINVAVTRHGQFAGIASEVVQVYIGFHSDPDQPTGDTRPVKDLREFVKVWDTTSFTLTLPPEAFHLDWDVHKRAFASPCESDSGCFRVSVGTSSSNIIASTDLCHCE